MDVCCLPGQESNAIANRLGSRQVWEVCIERQQVQFKRRHDIDIMPWTLCRASMQALMTYLMKVICLSIRRTCVHFEGRQ